ncbi:MAG TPA: hypothetical protein VK523_06425 [Steroidobacteraceae bacterium]|nr:hypothetical protein [Steroidobacteraceae bacterium]
MTKILLLLCAVALLSACNKDSGSPAESNAVARPKPKAPVVSRSGPTVAQQTAGMVQAANQGKSQVPVELKFDLGGRPKVGQLLEINLALIPEIAASPAIIQVRDADGLTVAPGGNQFDIPAAEVGEVYRQTVRVTPNAEGVLLVGVTVLLKHDDVTDQRAFSIPIIAER